MNESGPAIASLARKHRVDPEQLIVIHDEIDLAFLALRVKFGGSTAGHNGVRSVASAMRTPDFFRVRLGVGRPAGRKDAADWVLEDFPKRDAAAVAELVDVGADAGLAIISDGLDATQERFNRAGPR
jgi:PTH1 family peptidyl-tRNA hydrolase